MQKRSEFWRYALRDDMLVVKRLTVAGGKEPTVVIDGNGIIYSAYVTTQFVGFSMVLQSELRLFKWPRPLPDRFQVPSAFKSGQ